jgi:hypothetical protein
MAGATALAGDNAKPLPKPVIYFVGDFETGNWTQWKEGAQCENAGVPSTSTGVRGTITVQSATVGQGNYAAQFDLPASPEVRNACETLVRRPLGVNTDDYYGLMVRLPPNWQEPSPTGWGLSLAQLNFQAIYGTAVQLIAHADHISLVTQTGRCIDSGSPGAKCTYSSGIGGNVAQMIAARAPLGLNVWHEFVIHVRWAFDKTGVVEVWHRLRLHKIWYKTATLRGLPTLQWNTRGPAEIAADPGQTLDKIGVYRGYAAFPITIWEDGFVRTSSFAATAARLP